MRALVVLAVLVLASPSLAAALPEPAAALLAKARAQAAERARFADRIGAEAIPSRDGRSFALVWTPSPNPRGWIVTLHGSNGWAYNEIALWHPAAAEHGLGIVAWQWWYATGDRSTDYAALEALYRDIDLDLRDRRVPSRSVLLHGFSRGSANIYAVAAIDAQRGGRHVAMVLANAGGAAPDFPPNRRIEAGEFGPRPFAGLRFATFCGGRDPNPDRDGCPAMARSADWVRRFGGEVALQIADPVAAHGGFHRSPAHVAAALDAYLKALSAR